MLQKNYQALESQHICDVCSEAVTNPICPFCITVEIKAWLTLYPSLSKEILPIINKYLEKISNQIVNYGTECIKCKNKRAHVCPYCFTDFIFRELRRLNTPPFILKEFFAFFNFDSTHTGYTKEFEKMGVL